MYKITYNVAKINQYLTLDLSIFVQDEETLKTDPYIKGNKENLKTVRIYKIEGNTYIKFSPRPFVDLTIDPDQKGAYDPYKHIRCNRFDMFKLVKALEKMVYNFKTMTDLFYYYGNKLILDDTKVDKASIVISLRERTLKIVPTIIQDVDTAKQHEGIIIYVNSEAVSCPLMYSEMEYLLYILKTIDIDALASSLYMIDSISKSNTLDVIKEEVPSEVNTEPPPEDSTKTYATPKNGNTIPDI